MTSNERKDYQPLTLKAHNQYRRDFLPCFPTPFPSKSSSSSSSSSSLVKNENDQQPTFLFSNVPRQLLSSKQLQCRQRDQYPCPFEYEILGDDNPSFLNFMYRYLYQHFSERFRIDKSIVDYNLTRLDEAMTIMAMNLDQQRWTQEEQQKRKEERNIALDISQLAISLEIFLQTDVDMLYMKTCSYGGAQPRTDGEGIFCVNVPQARYGFLPCTREQCRCCTERRDLTGRTEPSVRFSSSHFHQFLNGYQVILNCPAICTTGNVIYVLKCVCHEFEYIGATKIAFCDRLWRHHQHGTRIMHEFILGETIIHHTLTEPKSTETLVKDRMRLYRHSTLCHRAMQMFLNCNPRYWCCIPMKKMDAIEDDRLSAQISFTSIHDLSSEEEEEEEGKTTATTTTSIRNDEDIQWFIDNLPIPPFGYQYSQRQRHEQYLFFKYKRDLIAPSSHLDLYNATIVFVLPKQCADFVRRFVETLFITHTECQLNTAGQLAPPTTSMPDDNHRPFPNPLIHDLWLEKLVHPSFRG